MKGSVYLRSKRWRAARRWSRRTSRRCPKWRGTRRCSSIRTSRERSPTASSASSPTKRSDARSATAVSREPVSFPGRHRCGASAISTSTSDGADDRSVASAPRVKLALVHDWLTGMRGGERALEVLCERFPDAELFTLVHVRGSVSPAIERLRPHTSFIQRLPLAGRFYRHYLPLMPTAVEQFDFDRFDTVVSVSHCCAKSIVRPATTRHICYCLTPMRYAWDQFDAYFGPERLGAVGSALMR